MLVQVLWCRPPLKDALVLNPELSLGAPLVHIKTRGPRPTVQEKGCVNMYTGVSLALLHKAQLLLFRSWAMYI